MEKKLANRIADLERPTVVTIDGFSGAGKTMLGEALARDLNSRDADTLLLEVELWAHGWSDLAGAVERVRTAVAALRRGPISTRTWNW